VHYVRMVLLFLLTYGSGLGVFALVVWVVR
jgi:hypothetical protein